MGFLCLTAVLSCNKFSDPIVEITSTAGLEDISCDLVKGAEKSEDSEDAVNIVHEEGRDAILDNPFGSVIQKLFSLFGVFCVEEPDEEEEKYNINKETNNFNDSNLNKIR